MSSDALAGALGALRDALDEAGARYMVIGGVAVIAYGVPRVTRDVDATVWAADLDPAELLQTLEAHGLRPRIPDALDFARRNFVLLLEHAESGTPMELTLAHLPFEGDAIARAVLREVGGVRVPLPDVSDLVLYKAVAWRGRDREDIERLLELHRRELDRDRILEVLGEFARALDDPERLEEVRRLLEEGA